MHSGRGLAGLGPVGGAIGRRSEFAAGDGTLAPAQGLQGRTGLWQQVVSEGGTLRLTLHVKVYPRNRLGEQVQIGRVREPVAFTKSLPEDLSNLVNDLRGDLLAQHMQCGCDAWQEGGDIAQLGQVAGIERIVRDGLFGFGQISACLAQGDADQGLGVPRTSFRSGRNPA